jgi:endonuclease G
MNRILLLLASVCCLTALAQRPVAPDTDYAHTKWGIEPENLVYRFAAFTVSFDGLDDNDGDGDPDAWRIPEWVAYEIKGGAEMHSADGTPAWVTENFLYRLGIAPEVGTYEVRGTSAMRVVRADYRFVPGQLCPANVGARISGDAANETYTLLNAVPQLQWVRDGIWKSLEDDILEWADRFGRVWVVCGPVFFEKSPALWLGQDDEEQAAVPDALFKIILREAGTDVKSLAFLIPNILPTTEEDYWVYLTIIDQIEELTGIDFLTALPESEQMEMEQVSGDTADWR